MPAKKRAVTIQQVAKAAGVSISTVSRVLNAKVDVASDTQERILGVINDLGYTSNLAARSMRSRNNNLIGLVVPDIGWPYSIEIMKGINRAITEIPYDLLVYTTGDIHKSGTATHEQHYVSLLNNSITDGVIIVASAAADFITDAPIVSVDPHIVNPNYPSVQGTNYQGALDATNYLLSLGHQRIGFICGRPEIGSALCRLNGYQDALMNAGVPVNEALIVPGDFTTPGGHRGAMQLLLMDNRPTAIFASNDQSALGVYQAAEELGFRVPDDLSVVGFDNISEAGYLGLTTINQFLPDMGYNAIQMLIKLINHEPLDEQIHKMQTKLVERNSCRVLSEAVAVLSDR
jgi:LacI family transcriptional regulator